MKKVLCVAAACACAFALTACGGNAAGDATSEAVGSSAAQEQMAVSDKAPVASTVETPPDSSSSSESNEEAPCPWNVPTGTWYGYDRFSGEQVSGLTINVYEVTAETFVFDWIDSNYGGEGRAFRGLTAFPDSSGYAEYDLGNGTVLNITLSDGLIAVDEVEGMGAMAYEFRQ